VSPIEGTTSHLAEGVRGYDSGESAVRERPSTPKRKSERTANENKKCVRKIKSPVAEIGQVLFQGKTGGQRSRLDEISKEVELNR